jgi:hypothetical protein
MLGWNRYGFLKRCARTSYADLVLLHPVEYSGHIVHSGASMVWNIDALYCLGGTGMDSSKGVLGQVMPILCYCIRWNIWVTLCIPGHQWCGTSTHYILCSGGTGTDSTKGALGHVTPN